MSEQSQTTYFFSAKTAIIKDAPENSWVVRKDIYEKYLEEHDETVREYEITQV